LIRSAIAAALLAFLLAACSGSSERERCAQCGMFVDIAPSWITGATTRDGDPIRFDTPRCLVAWSKSPAGNGSRDPWVTDYYDQRRVSAAEAQYVIGSDVIGPMGADFVPIGGSSTLAARFRDDHHGTRILSFGELDPTLLP
jgi:copper chaperone NosL